MKKLFILIFILLLSPANNVNASVNVVDTVQEDVTRSMEYADQITEVLKSSKNNYGQMMYQTLTLFESIGYQEPFMIALMAKSSGGRQLEKNGNFVGFYQIYGYKPYMRYQDNNGFTIDNRWELMKPAKKNIKLAVLLLDKIFQDVWTSNNYYDSGLINIAERFYCTPNHYSDIIYTCEGGAEWSQDWYYNYLPAADNAWYSR